MYKERTRGICRKLGRLKKKKIQLNSLQGDSLNPVAQIGSRIFILGCILNCTSQSPRSYPFFVQEVVDLHRTFPTNRLGWSSISSTGRGGEEDEVLKKRREIIMKYGKQIICVLSFRRKWKEPVIQEPL